MIPTRDGKRMSTDVYRPGKNGIPVDERFPVLLNRTPYNKTALASQAEFYAQRGYVVALQDTRGRYKSEGVFSKVQPVDATDGYDVIEWLAKQPYANGTVGMRQLAVAGYAHGALLLSCGRVAVAEKTNRRAIANDVHVRSRASGADDWRRRVGTTERRRVRSA